MATSRDKILEQLEHFDQSPPSSEPLELTLRTVLQFAGPQLLGMLPDDPFELDAYLLQGAIALLGLRSDGAEQYAITTPDPIELAEQLEAEAGSSSPAGPARELGGD